MLDFCIRPDFNFTYNGKRLCLNDASDWAFFANKLFNGAYDNTLVNIHAMDDWEDSVFLWEKKRKKKNPLSRKGRNRKARQNGKRNADKAKRLHKADRYHGKRLMPYKYKENGIIKDGISWVYHDCHWEVEDKIKYSENAMDAREQEYYSSYPVEEEAKEAEVLEQETTEEEAGNFDDFLWYLIDTLPEQKYIMLYSFDNGQSYENHDECANEFEGVKTKDEVIAELTENLLRHDCEVEVSKTEVRGLKGARFDWDFGHDKWGWNGYESFTIIPVSELN